MFKLRNKSLLTDMEKVWHVWQTRVPSRALFRWKTVYSDTLIGFLEHVMIRWQIWCQSFRKRVTWLQVWGQKIRVRYYLELKLCGVVNSLAHWHNSPSRSGSSSPWTTRTKQGWPSPPPPPSTTRPCPPSTCLMRKLLFHHQNFPSQLFSPCPWRGSARWTWPDWSLYQLFLE